MSSICINENDVQRIFFQENWLSVISNKKEVSKDILSILRLSGDVNQSIVNVICNNLIELNANNGTPFFIRMNANFRLNIKYFAKTEQFNLELVSADFISGTASKGISFDKKINVDNLLLIGSVGSVKIGEFLTHKNCTFANLVNIRSIKESVAWLAAQSLQLNKNLTYEYTKKAS